MPIARNVAEAISEHVPLEVERELIRIVVRGERLLPPDIHGWVMLLGRMAGWRPSKRHPLPGNEVLWRAYVQMQGMVRFWQATRAP